jgi:predicted ribosome quality control (RQC) complex YloA/Tae2 family protein
VVHVILQHIKKKKKKKKKKRKKKKEKLRRYITSFHTPAMITKSWPLFSGQSDGLIG